MHILLCKNACSFSHTYVKYRVVSQQSELCVFGCVASVTHFFNAIFYKSRKQFVMDIYETLKVVIQIEALTDSINRIDKLLQDTQEL